MGTLLGIVRIQRRGCGRHLTSSLRDYGPSNTAGTTAIPSFSPIRDGTCCDHDQVEHVVAERIAQPQEMSDIAVGDIRAQLDLHANNTVVAAFDSEINLLSSISGTQAIQRRSNAARYASPVVLAGT